MSITTRVVGATAVGLFAAAALVGCGTAPAPAKSAATSSYLPCILSDAGGFDDHSFNQLGFEGVKEAAGEVGSSYKALLSKTENDYSSNISNLVTQKCNLIVASGFALVGSIKTAATANPKTDFAMIDDNSISLPNVKPVVFETDEAAFLGGYVAASYSKTGAVGIFGGAQYPSVTLYMDGIADGIAYYNETQRKDIKLLGWNEKSQQGTFVGNFTDQNAARTITQNFLDQKADVVIPVGGPLYQGAAAAIKASPSNQAVMIGVDADIYQTDTNGLKGLFLTSILKNIKTSVAAVVKQSANNDKFDNSTYIGDLKNGGVGLAPFHDYAGKVDPQLSKQLETIKAGIIDGSINVESPGKLTK